MKNLINAVKIGKVINVSINGMLKKKVCSTHENANETFKKILEYKNDESDDVVNKILSILNEKTRIALECGLEHDINTGEIYLAGFNTPIPSTLVDVIKDYHKNDFPIDAIENFWKLLMCNPDTRVRESLFKFIESHDFSLTSTGYMIVYKAVYLKEDHNWYSEKYSALTNFVEQAYNKVKGWSTNPRRYTVYENNEGELFFTKTETIEKWDIENREIVLLGNLRELYEDFDKHNPYNKQTTPTLYTDMHSRTMDIEIGKPVTKERVDCDGDPAIDCSNGLHVGATKYVEKFSNNNSIILACYVNPANVVAVPNYDHSKMRVCEYFPFGVMDFKGDSYNEFEIIDQKFFEDDYCNYEVETLQKQIDLIQNEEQPIQFAMNTPKDDRPLSELKNIIKNRLIDIT